MSSSEKSRGDACRGDANGASALEALRESESKYRSLFEQAGDYILVLEPQPDGPSVIVDANEAAVEKHGFTRDEFIGKPISDLDDEANRKLVAERVKSVMVGEQAVFETTHIRKNGSAFPVEVSAKLLDVGDGPPRIVSIERDITERKRAELELAKYRDHLEGLVRDRTGVIEAQRQQVLDASRLKSEFLATMSHELRTPLNSILALSQLMLSGGTGEDLARDAEFLNVIERSGRSLLTLINDILDLSGIEAGRTKMFPSEFALHGTVEHVLNVVRPVAEAKALRFDVDLADVPTMYSDRERIGQILMNLLGNAVKFTETGRVAVTVSESGGMISLAVADTGIGVSPDVLPHIFDSFRQADGSNTRKYQGTGLGLAISQKLAGLLGGEITATSEVGKGSTFTLRLPVRMDDPGDEESPPAPPRTDGAAQTADAGPVCSTGARESETETGVILVVEDNADNLLATTAVLGSFGYRCATAVSGELALVAARAHTPALILMDIQLPVMDGLEATRQIKADAILKDIPIVALTAKAMKGDREAILAAGCDDYLSKPTDPELLRQVLRKWLG